MCESDSQLSSFFNRPTSAAEKFVKLAVLLTAPHIPAGMTGIRRNGPESAGMGPESAGVGIFLQKCTQEF